jgi:hypothetical protein
MTRCETTDLDEEIENRRGTGFEKLGNAVSCGSMRYNFVSAV